jgi:hypothetical protein
MSTSELSQRSRDEKSRSGVADRRSPEAPFSDLINRWLAEGDRISESARTVAAQPEERRLPELLRDLRAKADRHRFVVVFGAIALSAIAVIALRAFSHAVLKTDSTVAAEPVRPTPAVIVATAKPAPSAPPSAPSVPSADPLAPSSDPPAPSSDPAAPSADPAPAVVAAAAAPAVAVTTAAVAQPEPAATASEPEPTVTPPPAPAVTRPPAPPVAPAPALAATTPPAPALAATTPPAPALAATTPPAPALAVSAAPAADPPVSEHLPLPVTARPAPAPAVSAAPAADPPVSEHLPLPVTARPAPAARRPPLAAKTVPVNTRIPLEACQSAIRRERVQDALISCDKLTRESPKSADAVVLLAHANLLAGHDGETLRLARRASAIDPKCAEAYLLIGNVQQAAGRMPDARTAYEAYLHAAPRGAHAAEVRAILKTL